MNWQKITKTNHPEFDVPVLLGKRNDPSNTQEIKNYETACEYFKNNRR